jgi:hypothetical protein
MLLNILSLFAVKVLILHFLYFIEWLVLLVKVCVFATPNLKGSHKCCVSVMVQVPHMWSLGRQTVLPCYGHKLPCVVPPRIHAGNFSTHTFFFHFVDIDKTITGFLSISAC